MKTRGLFGSECSLCSYSDSNFKVQDVWRDGRWCLKKCYSSIPDNVRVEFSRYNSIASWIWGYSNFYTAKNGMIGLHKGFLNGNITIIGSGYGD
ncbi:uncharacterized protein DS421_16g539980 [Arachis hypogaea]|nr:uncharacterized protein DS421_16g539980 [Arachis hypogaea]